MEKSGRRRYVRNMITVFWVALGGAIGAAGRYLVVVQALRLFGPGVPWGTFTVNVAGSLAMGVLAGLFAQRLQVSNEIRMFLMTGVLGGFTTFSAFSLDVSQLVARKDYLVSAMYIIGSVSVSIAALFLGLRLARTFFA